MIGVSTVIVTVILGWGLYKAYSIATSDEGGREGWKSYMKCYAIFFFGGLVAIGTGAMAAISGQLSTALANFAVMLLVAPFMGMIVLGDVGKDTAKYMKENPEEAKEALDQASKIANTAAEIEDKRQKRKLKKQQKKQQEKKRKQREQAKKEHQKKRQQIKKKVNNEAHVWQMTCPKCGLAWGLKGSGAISSAEAIGVKIIGLDSTLDMTEVQCADPECLNTRRVRIDNIDTWKKAR